MTEVERSVIRMITILALIFDPKEIHEEAERRKRKGGEKIDQRY